MNIKLVVDGIEVGMNKFVQKILSGTINGAVTSLYKVEEDWKKIEITLTKAS